MIEIREVKTKKDLKKFIYYPLKLYKNEPNYTPPLFSDDYKDFTDKNPSLKVCKIKCFLAYKDKEIVGRLCAVINPPMNEKFNNKRMRFRHFDVIDDIEVTKALFKAAIEFGKEYGLDEVEGPNGFTDMDKEGMLIEGFEYNNLFITYYNYPYFVKHMEEIGMKKEVDWVEYRLEFPSTPDQRVDRISSLVKKRGYKVLKFKNHKEVKPYIHKAFDIYNKAFAPLYGTVNLSRELVEYYVGSFLPLLNSDFISIIEDKNQEVVGMCVVIPSLSKASKACNGKLFPFGWINLLHALNHNDTIDMLLIAVKPELQGLGINAILMNEIHKACIKHGIKYGETGPELENNVMVQSQWKTMEHQLTRRRRLWTARFDELKLD